VASYREQLTLEFLVDLKNARERLAELQGQLKDLQANFDMPALEIEVGKELQNQIELVSGLEQDLRDLGGVDLSNVDSSIANVSKRVDGVGARTGNRAGSIFANFTGNAAGDLAQLAGGFGAVSIAIDELVAAGSERRLTLSGVAKIAAPIAAIGAGMAIINSEMQRAEQRKEWRRDDIDAFRDAVEDVGAGVDAVRAKLLEAGELIPSIFSSGADGNIIPLLDAYAISAEDVAAAVAGGADGMATFSAQLDAANVPLAHQLFVLGAVGEQQSNYNAAIGESTANTNFFKFSLEGMQSAYQDFLDNEEPTRRMGEQWQTLVNAIADGEPQTSRAQRAFNQLREAFPDLSEVEIFEIATGMLEEQAAAAEEAAAAQREHTRAVAEAQRSLEEFVSGSSVRVSSAFRDQLDLGDVVLDTQEQLASMEDAVGELAAYADENPVTWSAAMDDTEFLSQLSGLRDQIQDQVADAFETGGAEAAAGVAGEWVEKIYQALDGALSREQIAGLLGLDDLQANIDVVVKEEALARAKASLDVLTGLTGETDFTAEIALQLIAGDISPEQAQALINEQLGEQGVEVPASLETPVTADAIAAAQADVAGSPVRIPVEVDFADAFSEFSFGRRIPGGDGGGGPSVTVAVDADTAEADASIDELAAEERTATVSATAETAAADSSLNAVANAKRTAVISATANTATAESALNQAARTRTATINGVLGSYPSAASIAARIGRVLVPIDAYIRNVPSIPKRATGDPYFMGGIVELGEQGREYAFLPQGTQIVPNHRADTVEAGTVVNYNTTIHNNLPAGSDPGDVMTATRRYARRNGGGYRP
jgi:hypothetical protein